MISSSHLRIQLHLTRPFLQNTTPFPRLFSTTTPSQNQIPNQTSKLISVHLFHRHGDRSPTKSIIHPPSTLKSSIVDTCDEIKLWNSKIACPVTNPITPLNKTFTNIESLQGDVFKKLDGLYPVVKAEPLPSVASETLNPTVDFLDSHDPPFGSLTWKGLDHLMSVGSRLRKTYTPNTSPSLEEFFDITNYSTNYKRTTLSTQALLSSLSPSQSIPINIRSNCPLNPFDTHPSTVKRVFARIRSSESFKANDVDSFDLVTLLCGVFKGLRDPYVHNAANADVPKGKEDVVGNKGINWIHCVDHFTCRNAHGVNLTDTRPNDNAETAATANEEIARKLETKAFNHLCKRFGLWLSDGELSDLTAGRILSDVLPRLQTEIDNEDGEGEGKKKFTVYSCHDVTLLALLYRFNADVLVGKIRTSSNGSNSDSDKLYWPGYGETLAVELHKSSINSEYFIKVLLNCKEIGILGNAVDEGEGVGFSIFKDATEIKDRGCFE